MEKANESNDYVAPGTAQVPVPPMQSAEVRKQYPLLSHLFDVIERKHALYLNLPRVKSPPRWVKLFDVPEERERLEAEASKLFDHTAELKRQLRVADGEFIRLTGAFKRSSEKSAVATMQLAQVGEQAARLQTKYNSMTFWQRLKWAFNPK